MHRLQKTLLNSFALLALGVTAHASDVTVVTAVPAFSTGPQIAQLFEGAWSQSGDFGCNASANQLRVTDLSGDCDEPVSRYTFVPTIVGNTAMTLRIQCSPTTPSFALGAGPLTPLTVGPNFFSDGGNSITVFFRKGPTGPGTTSVPTMSEWAAILLALMVVGFGAWRLRPNSGSAPTAA